MADEIKQTEAYGGQPEDNSYLASIVENSEDAIIGKSLKGEIISWNGAAERMYGFTADEARGQSISIIVPPDHFNEIMQILQKIGRGEKVALHETVRVRKDGRRLFVSLIVSPIKDASGKIIGASSIARDITEQKHAEEVIARQQQEILEISTPVVQLWPGVLALPLIGTLDSPRTQTVMERLLNRIAETGSSIAIIDITGVPTVDTMVAQHLLKTVAASRLMGTDCMISGIRPAIAQTIIQLGVNLSDIITKATLADAFAIALQRLGLTVTES
ncbi:MAG: PAS domain S-box protein [Omnitrophica WOR_2 bacterium]